VAFGTGGRLPVDDGAPAEATFTLEVNEWKGVSEPRLVLRQARPAQGADAEDEPRPGARTRSQAPARKRAPAQACDELVLFVD
jgi:hypothetical protein